MSSTNIAIFYHVFQINNWQEIFNEQMSLIQDSGLIDKIDLLHIGVNGNMIYNAENKKIICSINPNPHREEYDTLKSLKDFAESNSDYKILYIHTKGVSIGSPQTSDWRQYMNYFNIEKWKDALTLLDEYDTIGCNYKEDSSYGRHPHFSGNFWWARSEYIRTLDHTYLESDFRFNKEFWIGTGSGKMYEINNSNVNHYTERYERYKYVRG